MKVYDTIYPPRAVGAIFDRTQINHSPCKRTAYPQVLLLRITITARKEGARMAGGGRWGGKSFYGMKEWYGTGLHVNFRITSGYIFHIRILYFWRSAEEKSLPSLEPPLRSRGMFFSGMKEGWSMTRNPKFEVCIFILSWIFDFFHFWGGGGSEPPLRRGGGWIFF